MCKRTCDNVCRVITWKKWESTAKMGLLIKLVESTNYTWPMPFEYTIEHFLNQNCQIQLPLILAQISFIIQNSTTRKV